MDDKRFDEFWNTSEDKNEERSEHKQNEETSQSDTSKSPYYYYSYGPNKQGAYSSGASEENTAAHLEDSSNQPVDIQEPKRVYAYQPNGGQGDGGKGGSSSGGWSYSTPKTKKRGSLYKGFVTFVAGALVMGGMMYGADRANLFTGDQAASAPIGSSDVQTASSGSSSGSVVNTALHSNAEPNNVADIVKQANPAVVKVESYKKNVQQQNSMFSDPFFQQFFGGSSNQGGDGSGSNQGSGKEQAYAEGSGFIFDKSGYILTNEHVIDGADEVKVYVTGFKDPLVAKVLGSSSKLDLACLKVEGDKPFPTLPIGDSNQMVQGDWVIAIGNPYDYDHTVTVGVVSALDRPLTVQDGNETKDYTHMLQTDASINPGNSGGPLLNMDGQVIGINTAVNSQAQGIGFAIPTSTINSVLSYLESGKPVPLPPKPYIGIYMADLQKSWLQDLKVDSTDGVLVQSVIQGSPAQEAGLQPYDVILEYNGKKVSGTDDLSQMIKDQKVGDKVTFTISRNGTKMTTGVIIGDQNKAQNTSN